MRSLVLELSIFFRTSSEVIWAGSQYIFSSSSCSWSTTISNETDKLLVRIISSPAIDQEKSEKNRKLVSLKLLNRQQLISYCKYTFSSVHFEKHWKWLKT